MSYRLMRRATYVTGLNPTAMLTLIVLAEMANDQGFCWPNWRTISVRLPVGRSQLYAAVALLIQEGHLTRKRNGDRVGFVVHPKSGIPDATVRNTVLDQAQPSGMPDATVRDTGFDSPEFRTNIYKVEPVSEPVIEPVIMGRHVAAQQEELAPNLGQKRRSPRKPRGIAYEVWRPHYDALLANTLCDEKADHARLAKHAQDNVRNEIPLEAYAAVVGLWTEYRLRFCGDKEGAVRKCSLDYMVKHIGEGKALCQAKNGAGNKPKPPVQYLPHELRDPNLNPGPGWRRRMTKVTEFDGEKNVTRDQFVSWEYVGCANA